MYDYMAWVYCQLSWPSLQPFPFVPHDPKVNFLGGKVMEIWLFFNFKKLYCNYLPFRSPFMASYYSSSLSWVDMHWSHESEDIYNFQLAIWVNTNNIGDFFTTKLCPLRDPVRALIGFGRCQIASPDGPSCSAPISTRTVLLHQLRAKSWKYTCLRTMDCLHHVTETWKVLKGLNGVWGQVSEVV